MPSRVQGIISTRRLLKRLPEAVRGEIATAMQQAGPELAAAIVARTPVLAAARKGRVAGALRAGVTWRFYPATLRLSVGFIGRPTNRRLFYARIMEGGRKAQDVTVTRHRVTGGTGRTYRKNGRTLTVGAPYIMRVTRLAPRRFVYGRLTDLRQGMTRRLQGIWERAIARIAENSDD